jgi:hypothetical protein
MARISTYIKDTGLTDKDLLVGSNYVSGSVGQEIYETANFTLDAVKSYIGATGGDSTFLKETTITLGYDELSLLNGGTTTTTFAIPGFTSTSALAIVDVLAYLEAGTTAFDLSFNTSLILGLGSGANFKPKVPFTNNSNFINSSTSVYFNQGVQPMTQGAYYDPSPLGAELSVKFAGIGGITQGNGTLTLKVLYRLIDFS